MGGERTGTRERAFAKRLTQALDNHDRCPEAYGRNTWLKRELAHQRIEVSIETIRKWLSGETMPRRPKMAALAKTLRVDETWLAMGLQPLSPAMTPSRIDELEAVLREIEEMTEDAKIRDLIASTRKH